MPYINVRMSRTNTYYKYGTSNPKLNELEYSATKYYACTKKEFNKIIKAYENAIARNDSHAMNLLGECYEYGVEFDNGKSQFTTDLQKAINLYRKSADNNNTDGLYKLVHSYAKDNPKEQFELLTKAANLDNAHALAMLGLWYQSDQKCDYVEKDLKKAFECFNRAAKLNNANAITELGRWYEHGKYVKKNHEHAFELYKKAAKLGDTYGMLRLADCHEKGIGTKKDIGAAMSLHLSISYIDEGIDTHKINTLLIENKEEADKYPYFNENNYQKSCATCFKSNVRRAVYRCECRPHPKICCKCFLKIEDAICPLCKQSFFYRST